MNALKVIDVTLRDGGHRTGFGFDDEHVNVLLSHLDNARIDYVEVGYRNGILPFNSNIGAAGFCPNAYLAFCKSHLTHVKMAVMVYPQLVEEKDLTALHAHGVDLLRICMGKKDCQAACHVLDMAKHVGLNASINLTHTSLYQDKELDARLEEIAIFAPEIVYLADSNGSLTPLKIRKIYERYTARYPFAFGFHAHDNLGLAQINSLTAYDCGAQFIDCSLAGLGKGIGNLRAEFFIAYLQTLNMNHYNLECILKASNYVRQTFHTEIDAIELDEFLKAISDLSGLKKQ